MPRKKPQMPATYRMMVSAPAVSSPEAVEETGTVRLSVVLNVLNRVLAGHDELRQQVADAFALEGADAKTRILP